MSLSYSLTQLPPLALGHSRLYLCRHGETDSNAQDLLQGSGVDAMLNVLGRSQASALGESLASICLNMVASSTLSRAIETSDIIANRQAVSVERWRDAGLSEMFYGSLEGLPIAGCRQKLKELSAAWQAGDTGVAVGGDGESPDMLLARAHAALWGDGALLNSRVPGRHVAVVAHSSFNRAVLSVATGKGLGNMFAIPQDNACVNVLDFCVNDAAISVIAINMVPSNS
eukprot:CAMPEP_0119312316 /NCGR_PEP_ID=MMETSP1333-20130426/25890_1 /TAXON_ID=418940 /ORGANISM="Scyphosphaera apsteinii, Strain RCC1455" /LENGTH=227 /DNA_ID=CAMNT_0007316917 /DNA_START=93 /DNA_END=776 /DNA_ORIENTATION=-